MQNQRGGRICLRDVAKPDCDDWLSGLQAMECAFHLEMTITKSILELHQLATDKGNPHLRHFLQRHYLRQQVETLGELTGYLTDLRKVGAPEDGLTEYLCDRLTLGDNDKD
jgi:ferritin heavy chain